MFHNLLEMFKQNLPLWHRYWKIRRKALGVKTLHPYDVVAPLTTKKHKVPFEKAVEWICEGLAPMGEEYVSVIRQGCLEDRWVDWAPNSANDRARSLPAYQKGHLSVHHDELYGQRQQREHAGA